MKKTQVAILLVIVSLASACAAPAEIDKERDQVVNLGKGDVWLKISAFRPVLTQQEKEPQECLTDCYIMAFTSGIPSAGSDAGHAIEITVDGVTRRQLLTDLPGDDYAPNKGDLWEYTITSFNFPQSCIKKNDIDNIAIVQNSNDGWHIKSITTFFKDTIGRSELVSMDLDADHWIDGDTTQDHRRLDLTLTN